MQNFSKIRSKIFENFFFENIAFLLVEDAKPFHLIRELIFYCQYEEGVGFFVSVTNGQTDRQTAIGQTDCQ